jgi:hypothetical protein
VGIKLARYVSIDSFLIYLFLQSFQDALSVTQDCIASNRRMIREKLIGKGTEGSGRGLI